MEERDKTVVKRCRLCCRPADGAVPRASRLAYIIGTVREAQGSRTAHGVCVSRPARLPFTLDDGRVEGWST